MTMWAETGMTILTVIVMPRIWRLDIFFFQPVRKGCIDMLLQAWHLWPNARLSGRSRSLEPS